MEPIHAERFSWLVLIVVLLFAFGKHMHDANQRVTKLERTMITCFNGGDIKIGTTAYGCTLVARGAF